MTTPLETPSNTPLRTVVIDDHPMVREGLRSMLRSGAIEIVGEAGRGDEAVRLVRELGPDIVLLDMKLPDMDGIAVLRELKEAVPRAAVLIVSMHDDPQLVRRAVEAGAAGYLLKGVSRRELLAAVQAAHDGESVLDPALLRAVLGDSSRRLTGPATPSSLTSVELDVLRLIAGGLTNREIGERLRWSVGAVKKYVQQILEKLEVSDRTQAAVVAVRRGLLD